MATKSEKICTMCVESRKEMGKEPQELVSLPEKTENKRLTIYVCPDCDFNGEQNLPKAAA